MERRRNNDQYFYSGSCSVTSWNRIYGRTILLIHIQVFDAWTVWMSALALSKRGWMLGFQVNNHFLMAKHEARAHDSCLKRRLSLRIPDSFKYKDFPSEPKTKKRWLHNCHPYSAGLVYIYWPRIRELSWRTAKNICWPLLHHRPSSCI